MGKIETKGIILPKNTIAYQNTLSKKKNLRKMLLKPVVIKTSESNSLKGDPLEIQHPKFENSRLSLIESVHER